MRKTAGGFLAAAAIAACTTDEFAGVDGGDGGATDVVAVDRAVADAASDVAIDVVVDAWKPPAPVDCKFVSGALLCADFEQVAVDQGWTTTNTLNGGTLALDVAQFYSPSHSAMSAIPAAGTPTAAELAFAALDAGGAQKVTLRYAFRVEVQTSLRLSILTFTAANGTAKYSISLTAPSLVELDVSDGTAAQTVPIGPYSVGSWNHVSLEVRPNAGAGFTVTVNDVTKTGAGPQATGAPSRDIRVGAQRSTANGAPASVRYDDVVYTAN